MYGICGIGNGHTYRQLPIVEYFSGKADVAMFAYDRSYEFYSARFKDRPNVRVFRVAVPFFTGGKDGLDWRAMLKEPYNKGKDFFMPNVEAMAQALEFIGKPDLVISDYEMVSAQYAYAYDAPLVTIDQQSKYLCGDFPAELNGYTFADEIVRLHMFFPKAAARIACSFFKFPLRKGGDEVLVFPPVIKDSVVRMKREPAPGNELLVYISSAREFVQSPEEAMRILITQPDETFNLFVPKDQLEAYQEQYSNILKNVGMSGKGNIMLHRHGDSEFATVMQRCSGIISTAGHSLLSEAMYLGIPVYAIPVSPYEQQMNAYVIGKHGFGISHSRLDAGRLREFVDGLDKFADNIRNDKDILLRGIGQEEIIRFLERI